MPLVVVPGTLLDAARAHSTEGRQAWANAQTAGELERTAGLAELWGLHAMLEYACAARIYEWRAKQREAREADHARLV